MPLPPQPDASARPAEDLARELAERTSDLETVGESVTHDLRNPLNTISLNVHLLRTALEKHDVPLGETALGHLERSQQQMAAILDRLQSFTRASCVTLCREPLDMAALAREAFSELRLERPTSAVEFQVDEDLPAADGDPDLVRVLLQNLLDNALKYTRETSPAAIEVGAVAGSDPVVYYVRDNGVGFDPVDAEAIFLPFRRPGAGERSGHGVGLAVAHRVARRHHGEIWAEGRPGQGAAVYFHLGKPESLARG